MDVENPEARYDLGLLMALASAQGVLSANEALTELAITSREFAMLDLVDGANGVSQRQLAEALRLDPSQVVGLVDRLEARGYVERRPNPNDRRQRSIALTARGRPATRRARELVDAALLEVLRDLTTEERELLRELLLRVVRRHRRLRRPG